MPSELDERVSFFLTIPFFSHWFKKKVRNIMASCKVIRTVRGQVLQTQGLANNYVYIVRSGEFQALQ